MSNKKSNNKNKSKQNNSTIKKTSNNNNKYKKKNNIISKNPTKKESEVKLNQNKQKDNIKNNYKKSNNIIKTQKQVSNTNINKKQKKVSSTSNKIQKQDKKNEFIKIQEKKDKYRLVITSSILFFLFILALLLLLIPRINITLKGNNIVNLSVGNEYIEEGAYASINSVFFSDKLDVKIDGKINTNKPGKYLIYYSTNKGILSGYKTRIVNVIDDLSPEITIKNDITYCKNKNLIGIDVQSIDNVDGDISKDVKYQIIDSKIHVYSIDSSGNKSLIVRDLKIIDNEKPTMKLNGDKIIYNILGNPYQEKGATANDSCDGNISNKIKIEGSVDVNNTGIYEIKYSVSDSNNNDVNQKRTVIVLTEEQYKNMTTKGTGGGTIYLTFDDGPGMYTESILNILDKYGVKATFFVTNQFPTYQHMIKEEYQRGHTVAIHTYSHNFKTVYASVESYLDDFNKMYDIILSQTGVAPKYFRFPGGTSNHVAKVKMSELANLMTEKGFKFYDWHVDSGDTHGNKATKDYIVNMIKNHVTGNGDYIILMHDIKKNTMEALPEVIEYGLTYGYQFKVIDDSTPLKQSKPYK